MVSGTAVNRFLWWVYGLGGGRPVRGCAALLNRLGFQLRGMEAARWGARPWAEGDPASPRHPRTSLKVLALRCHLSALRAKGDQV